MTTDTPAPLTLDVTDGLATITLARPQAMNSLDTATKEALLGVIRQVADDDHVRAVVLTGSGRAFCVGQDLKEHVRNLGEKSMEEIWATVDQHYSPIALGLATMPKPVVAAVGGVAAGAGLSLALACDLRIAADSASFTTAFTGIALSCDTGSSWTLPRVVGPTRAMDLLLRPRSVGAAEALDIGLVTEVVPADDLGDRAAEVGRELAAGPTMAYASVKQSVAYSATHPLADSLALESRMMARTGSSDDHRRAVDAFVNKQQPTFTGR